MSSDLSAPFPRPSHHSLWWQVALLLVVSCGFESVFLHHRLNVVDEGWPLYAAMQLHAGGTLYRDVFWVFPPGHVLAAWIAWALDPPGVVASRVIYSAFNVATCVGIFFLGRRVMRDPFPLFGALLLAVAAPRSHMAHQLFGYRYLIFGIVALLLLAKRLRTGDARWMLAAGLATGTAVCFRLTPGFAVACALAASPIIAERSVPRWVRDWAWLGLGIGLVVGPVLAWIAADVGLETIWREVVVRPVAMTDRQNLAIPSLGQPLFLAGALNESFFIALQFRLWAVLYAVYGLALIGTWVRSWQQRRPFDSILLFSIVIFGAVYYIRAFGRSDEPHLDSTLPPACLLVAHALYWLFRTREGEGATWRKARRWVEVGVMAVLLTSWIFLLRVDAAMVPALLGQVPLRALDGRVGLSRMEKHVIDSRVDRMRESIEPTSTLLDLSSQPIYHVLSRRPGPGWADVIMPGTFLDEAEERAFVARLDQSPPQMVLWPPGDFDQIPERGIERAAPHLVAWVRERFERSGAGPFYHLLVPRSAGDDGVDPGSGEADDEG